MCISDGCSCISRNRKLRFSLDNEKQNAETGRLLYEEINLPGVYETSKYDFLRNNPACPASVQENLWEQAKLNTNIGLYRVNNINEQNMQPDHVGRYPVSSGDVFQLRGYDLANMTIIYNGESWIIMDVLTTSEMARAVWCNIVQKYLNDNPIKTIIYSHSHVDHYAGVGGLMEFCQISDAPLIIAPEGFTKYAVSENIYAGTAMSRRAMYQYGNRLPVNENGQVDCGLGKRVSVGTNTIRIPDREVSFSNYNESQNYCQITSGWLELQIQLTPGTEAPAEMNVYLPKQKVLFIAENCAGTLHNILTPRGAQVRDPLMWAGYLDETLTTFSEMETLCSAHNWPRFGNGECIRFIEIQRDMYRYINNATLHLINCGYTIDEIGRMISGEGEGNGEDSGNTLPIPEDFLNEWCCHGFYGTYNHDAKAVYQKYIGWYDGNPSHLNQHKLTSRANRYITAFTAEAIIQAARKANGVQDYTWAVELFDYLFNADDGYVDKKTVQDLIPAYQHALTQLGYMSEAASWRNMYLTAAQEISQYGQNNNKPQYLSFPDDTVNAMTLEMILQYLGITLDCRYLADTPVFWEGKHFRMNIIISQLDMDDEYAEAVVTRGIIHYRVLKNGHFPQNCAISIKGSKLQFFRAFVDHDITAINSIVEEQAQREAVKAFIMGYLTRFDLNFPIMTPRKGLNEQKEKMKVKMMDLDLNCMLNRISKLSDCNQYIKETLHKAVKNADDLTARVFFGKNNAAFPCVLDGFRKDISELSVMIIYSTMGAITTRRVNELIKDKAGLDHGVQNWFDKRHQIIGEALAADCLKTMLPEFFMEPEKFAAILTDKFCDNSFVNGAIANINTDSAYLHTLRFYWLLMKLLDTKSFEKVEAHWKQTLLRDHVVNFNFYEWLTAVKADFSTNGAFYSDVKNCVTNALNTKKEIKRINKTDVLDINIVKRYSEVTYEYGQGALNWIVEHHSCHVKETSEKKLAGFFRETKREGRKK